MTDSISEAEFSAASGVEEWRARYWGAKAYFRTGDFATGAAFVTEIAQYAGAAVGYVHVGETTMVEPNLIGPSLGINQKGYVAPRNRIHVDVSVPHDHAQARVDAIIAAGGRLLGDRHAPAFWSLIDAAGNVVDIATWQERD